MKSSHSTVRGSVGYQSATTVEREHLPDSGIHLRRVLDALRKDEVDDLQSRGQDDGRHHRSLAPHSERVLPVLRRDQAHGAQHPREYLVIAAESPFRRHACRHLGSGPVRPRSAPLPSEAGLIGF